MARLRAALAEGAPMAAGSARGSTPMRALAPGSQRVQMLKVITIERGPLGQQVERALFVFGADHIRRYREQQRRAAQAAADVAAWRSAGGSASGAGREGEASSCVSSGCDSLQSSAVGGKGAASPKRAGPGSDATEP